jgi:hypothetical protein
MNVQDGRGDGEVMRRRGKERVWRALSDMHFDCPGGTNETGRDGIAKEVYAVSALRQGERELARHNP